MSVAGFKKQFNKTSQFLSEKVGGNKGSEIEEDIVEMGRKLDVVNQCVENMQTKTKEYLQPNPTARTKMAMQSTYQKARGQVSNVKYPQPEFNLAEVFCNFGGGLNDGSPYACALTDVGAAFHELSETKDNMEMKVSQNFLGPLNEMQHKELKEISQHRKKLEGRRLDYDYKKSKGAKVTSDELEMAQSKFYESKELCVNSMANFMDNDVEHISQLLEFAQSICDYHKQCEQIVGNLTETLSSKLSEASSRPRGERHVIQAPVHIPNTPSPKAASAPMISAPVMQQPCCRAVYDFEAENEGELEFKEGQIIQLSSRIDENWLEGSCNGRSGYFPCSFVEIMVPL